MDLCHNIRFKIRAKVMNYNLSSEVQYITNPLVSISFIPFSIPNIN